MNHDNEIIDEYNKTRKDFKNKIQRNQEMVVDDNKLF